MRASDTPPSTQGLKKPTLFLGTNLHNLYLTVNFMGRLTGISEATQFGLQPAPRRTRIGEGGVDSSPEEGTLKIPVLPLALSSQSKLCVSLGQRRLKKMFFFPFWVHIAYTSISVCLLVRGKTLPCSYGHLLIPEPSPEIRWCKCLIKPRKKIDNNVRLHQVRALWALDLCITVQLLPNLASLLPLRS